MAGRRSKPTALKKLTGNPGKRPLNDNEPKFEGKAKCPRHLDNEARREWRRVSTELERLGLLTSADRAMLTAYCQCWSHSMRAEKDIQRYGQLVAIEKQDKEGKFHVLELRKNPAVTTLRDMLQQMRQYATEFGLSPSSRSKVQAPTQVHTHEHQDPFAEIAAEEDDGEGTKPN
jgi:P27 family predicted phage terminase small subunit